MTYRKTWFSYVLWILYTILCAILLTVFAGGVWTAYLAGIPYDRGFPAPVITPLAGWSDDVLFVLGLLILPVTVFLYWAVRSLAGVIRKKYRLKERTQRIWECATVLLILAGGVTLRIMCMQHVISMAGNELFVAEQIDGMQYYDMAVAGGNMMSYTLNRISYLYVTCLSVAVSFLGHKIASAIVLQMILQIAGILLAYVVTRKIAGRLPACIVLLYLSCSRCCLRMLTCFGPEWLFFVLYMIGMLIVVSFIRNYCENRLSKLSALFGAAAAGAVAGMLVCIVPAAAPLMLMFVAVATGHKKKTDEAPIYHSVRVSAAVIAVAVLVCALMLVSAVWFGSPDGRFDFGNLKLWNTFGAPFINLSPYLYDVYIFGLLIIPASFLIFEFFRSGREQNYTLWILLCIIVAPTPLAVIGDDRFGLLSLYIWAVLAGLGLQNCMFGGRAKVVQAVIEQINAAADREAGDESTKSDGTEEMAGDNAGINGQEQTENTEDIYETADSGRPQNPRFIENPLPLPKKHVKKEMDYQYPVEEKDMKYDIEVSEQDDFDIS